MLRLLVILVSVFALSKVAFAVDSVKGSAETTAPVTEVNKDAALQDDAAAEKGMSKKEEGKGSKK